MNATPSELLMRNFKQISIELDPVRRAALLAESYTEDCLWIHPGGRVLGRDGINEAASVIRRHFPEYRYTVTKRDAWPAIPLHRNRLPRRARWTRVTALHVHRPATVAFLKG
jgi:hypothetical protein